MQSVEIRTHALDAIAYVDIQYSAVNAQGIRKGC